MFCWRPTYPPALLLCLPVRMAYMFRAGRFAPLHNATPPSHRDASHRTAPRHTAAPRTATQRNATRFRNDSVFFRVNARGTARALRRRWQSSRPQAECETAQRDRAPSRTGAMGQGQAQGSEAMSRLFAGNLTGFPVRSRVGTFVLALSLLATVAQAAPLPVPKPQVGGSCPHGYTSSGSFCVPREGAQDALPRPPSGSCPNGWLSSGSFCLRSGATR
jgi:hypothetical protein